MISLPPTDRNKTSGLAAFIFPFIFLFISLPRVSNRKPGRSGGAMVLGKLSVPERPTLWITVGQGSTALAAGAGGLFRHFYSHLSLLFSFSLSLGDGPI